MEKDDVLQRCDFWNYFEVWSKNYQQILFFCPRWEKSKWVLWWRYISKYYEEREQQEIIDKYEQFWDARLPEDDMYVFKFAIFFDFYLALIVNQ